MCGRLTTRYVLRFPFELEGNRGISGLEKAFCRTFNSLAIRLERSGRFYVVTIDGFTSADAANRFITSVWAGLTWALLNRSIAFRAVLEPRRVVFADDPVEATKNISKSFGDITFDQPLDGLVDGHAPCVYPSDRRVRVVTANSVTLRMNNSVEEFFASFAEGLSATNAEAVAADTRLRTALELYNIHFTETSRHAKLLTLVMALECLTIKSDKHPVAIQLLKNWHAEIKGALGTYTPGSEEHFSLKCLEREILYRHENSIRSRVRDLVLDTFSDLGLEQASDLAKTAVDIYDMRGALVHRGTLPEKQLAQAYTDARQIVAKLLRAKFRIARPSNGT